MYKNALSYFEWTSVQLFGLDAELFHLMEDTDILQLGLGITPPCWSARRKQPSLEKVLESAKS